MRPRVLWQAFLPRTKEQGPPSPNLPPSENEAAPYHPWNGGSKIRLVLIHHFRAFHSIGKGPGQARDHFEVIVEVCRGRDSLDAERWDRVEGPEVSALAMGIAAMCALPEEAQDLVLFEGRLLADGRPFLPPSIQQ